MPGPPTTSSRATAAGVGRPIYATATNASGITLSGTPSVAIVSKDGVVQHLVGSAPTEGNYTQAGAVLTLGGDPALVLDVWWWS